MNRFFGMMPQSEIEIEKAYYDDEGFRYILQAGRGGWSILYTDGSSDYKDVNSKPEDNFKEAYDKLCSMFRIVKEA